MRARAAITVPAVALSLALGTLVSCGGSDGQQAARLDPASSPLQAIDPTLSGSIVDPADEMAPAQGAPSPAEAVTTYLTAEQSSNAAAGFAVLTDTERATIGSAEAWMAGRVDRPVVLGFTVADTMPVDDSNATVTAQVRYEPRLDLITGLFPASGTATFTTVRLGDGWRVAASATTVEADLPDEAGAAASAEAFVLAHQRCEPAAAPVYEGSLLYSPTLADALCGTDEVPTAGAPNDASALADPTPLLSAFGDSARTWARVVPMDGPARLDVVTAPFGDRWVVVGVTAP